MKISMQVNLLPIYLHGSIFTPMEGFMDAGGSIFTFMEVNGRFHGIRWKFSFSIRVEASIVSINCSFDEHITWKLSYTHTTLATYNLHEYHSIPDASTRLP